MKSHAGHMAILFAAVMLLSLCISCDPPNFVWPDKLTNIEKINVDSPTEYDHWKEMRRAQKDPQLIVGSAVVDLTPKRGKGYYIAGYGPNKRSNGVVTPVTARVLFMDDGQTSLALVGTDFVGLMNDRIWDARHKLSRSGNQLDLVVTSAHNHSGPDTMGLWGSYLFYMLPVESGVEEGYMNRISTDIARAVTEAAISARPATLKVVTVKVPDGINENLHRPGYKDNDMTVLQARGLDGGTIATLVNYTCHAEFSGQNHDKIYADYPGYLYAHLEELEGGNVVFMNGALGGMIAPAMPRWTENHPRLRTKRARLAGRYLAEMASIALKNAEAIDNPKINIDRRLIRFPVENDGFTYLSERGFLKRVFKNGMMYSETWRIDIGPLGIVTVPGEILPALGFEIKGNIMHGRHKMILGLANDEIGYIMNPADWQDPLYEYERSVSLGPQTGNILMENIRKLYPDAKGAGSAGN